MIDVIERTFENIPAELILEIAGKNRLSGALTHSAQLAEDHRCVTAADREIQRKVLEYFGASALSGVYSVKAEESLSAEEEAASSSQKLWQLIVDPLDGTGSFLRGEKTWGAMIGLCDRKGELQYSWNLISTGEIFSSFDSSRFGGDFSWQSKINSGLPLRIDVYDYGNEGPERFSAAFQSAALKQPAAASIANCQIQVTSCPAAVWTGWELYNRRLDGLLWLPGEKGKGSYPDYDLIFLGALRRQGWKIALGKQDGSVQMLAVAPSESDLELLLQMGLSMTPSSMNLSIDVENGLLITAPAENLFEEREYEKIDVR